MSGIGRKPTDGELEERLRASFGRAVGRAAEDLRDGALVGRSLRRAATPSTSRLTWAGALVAMLVVLAGMVALAGGTQPDEARPFSPSASPIAGSPPPSVPGDDGGGIPILAPGVTFPPEVQGRVVLPLTAENMAAIAKRPDASPFLVSGWLGRVQEARRDLGCQSFPSTTPAPNGVLLDQCLALGYLHERADGGVLLPILGGWEQGMPRFIGLPATQTMRVLVEVHVRDAGCRDSGCAAFAVLDRVVMYGQNRYLPELVAASLPPGGLSLQEAIDAALAYGPDTGFKEPLTILSVEAGPSGLFSGRASEGDLRWVWLIRFVSEDGYRYVEVEVGYLDGVVSGSGGGSLRLP